MHFRNNTSVGCWWPSHVLMLTREPKPSLNWYRQATCQCIDDSCPVVCTNRCIIIIIAFFTLPRGISLATNKCFAVPVSDASPGPSVLSSLRVPVKSCPGFVVSCHILFSLVWPISVPTGTHWVLSHTSSILIRSVLSRCLRQLLMNVSAIKTDLTRVKYTDYCLYWNLRWLPNDIKTWYQQVWNNIIK